MLSFWVWAILEFRSDGQNMDVTQMTCQGEKKRAKRPNPAQIDWAQMSTMPTCLVNLGS